MELMPTDVSIIIVNWNTRQLLEDCLSSLLKEKSECHCEIIVVDNGSTDDSCRMVSEKFPEVKLVCNKDNLGFSKANNIGIECSSGRYICLVNSDIVVIDDCVDKMWRYMEENPTTGILGPKTLNGDGTLRPNCQRLPTLWNQFCRAVFLHRLFPGRSFFAGDIMTYFDHDAILHCESLPGCFLMVRREATGEVGVLDEDFFIYGEDKDWCRRFDKSGWEIVFLPEAEAIHYSKGSSSTAPVRFVIEKIKSDLHYWRKHHSVMTRLLYRVILLMHHFVRVFTNGLMYLARPSQRHIYKSRVAGNLVCISFLLKDRI